MDRHPFVGATSGAVGAVIALACTYPLIVVKQRLQADSIRRGTRREARYAGSLDCLSKTIKGEGVAGMYAGVGLALPKTAMWNFVYYYFFTLLRPLWERSDGRSLSFFHTIAHGVSAGIGTQLVMLPVDAVNIRVIVKDRSVQSTVQDPASTSNVYLRVIRELYEEGGLRNFWRGLAPGLLLTINPGIVQLIRKTLTEWRISSFRRSSGTIAMGARKTTSVENFWIGLIAKLIASTITYPLVIAKIVMTTASKKKKNKAKRTTTTTTTKEKGRLTMSSDEGASVGEILKIWRQIVMDSGFTGVYKGIQPHLVNASLKAGITNAVRLRVVALVVALFCMSFSAFSSKTRRLVVSIVQHRRAYLDSTQAVILADTFKKADLDGNGVLSRTEIKDQLAPFIGLKMSEEEVDDFIVRADKNKDGNVDYEEFIQMVSKQN
eukprot:g2729.t1